MKPATVIISGRAPGENLQDIDVPPGSTALDVLKAVGLDRNWTLSREGSNQTFAHEEPIFDAIEEGCKLRAAPLAEVGGGWTGFMAWLLEILGLDSPGVVRRPRVRTGLPQPSRPTAVVRAAARPVSGRVVVARDRGSLLEVRGWRRQGGKLIGAYRLGKRGAFAGEIDISNPYRPQFFIINPPEAVLNGSHSACFRKRKKGKYAVHFGIADAEPDAGVLAIEKLLASSI